MATVSVAESHVTSSWVNLKVEEPRKKVPSLQCKFEACTLFREFPLRENLNVFNLRMPRLHGVEQTLNDRNAVTEQPKVWSFELAHQFKKRYWDSHGFEHAVSGLHYFHYALSNPTRFCAATQWKPLRRALWNPRES